MTESAPAEPGRARWVAPAVVVAAVAGTGGALGALGGWLWYLWWAPAREGRIYRTAEGPRWFPNPWDPGQAQVFAGTAEFAIVGLGLGLLVGLLAGLLGRRLAFAGLVGLLLGTALAAGVAYLVGTAISPPDPQSLVDSEPVGATLPAAIEVSGWTPYLCWPLGGLLGFLVATYLVSALDDVRRREADTSSWLEPGS